MVVGTVAVLAGLVIWAQHVDERAATEPAVDENPGRAVQPSRPTYDEVFERESAMGAAEPQRVPGARERELREERDAAVAEYREESVPRCVPTGLAEPSSVLARRLRGLGWNDVDVAEAVHMRCLMSWERAFLNCVRLDPDELACGCAGLAARFLAAMTGEDRMSDQRRFYLQGARDILAACDR